MTAILDMLNPLSAFVAIGPNKSPIKPFLISPTNSLKFFAYMLSFLEVLKMSLLPIWLISSFTAVINPPIFLVSLILTVVIHPKLLSFNPVCYKSPSATISQIQTVHHKSTNLGRTVLHAILTPSTRLRTTMPFIKSWPLLQHMMIQTMTISRLHGLSISSSQNSR
jgi:hypothetical protein